MNKLGFYTQNFQHVAEPIRRIKPPVLLAEMRDRGALRETRNNWSPDTFIIGRFHFDHPAQGAALDGPDPASVGRAMAERFISEDSFFAKQRGLNGRLIVDAWMTLNEVLPGPASRPWQENRPEIIRRAKAYDILQVAFLERMHQDGLEAVAFNFAAGNWLRGEDYLEFFPETLKAYTYLGFHEYGWPFMNPDEPNTSSGCGVYRQVMEAIRAEHGPHQHKAIITEAGLARMFRVGDAGDVGWLYRNPQTQVQEVSEESYRKSLRWYNQFLAEDDYALGACLFMVGVGGHDWLTFEHVGPVEGHPPLTLMNELFALAQEITPVSFGVLEAAAAFAPPLPPFVAGQRRLSWQEPFLQGADVKAVQQRLAALGYLSNQLVNGIFNEATHRAVQEFQQVNQLIVDGIVGPQTWQALASQAALPRPPQPVLGHFKIGLDLNSPLNAATGDPWGPVTQPDVVVATEAHWTRLNFILGPGHHPDPAWLQTYDQIIKGITGVQNGAGPQIYGLIGAQAAHRDPRNLFRFPPVEVDWAWRGYSHEERQRSLPYIQTQINMMGEQPEAWIERYAEHFAIIVEAFHDQVHIFEAFNEPNDWHLNTPSEDQIDPLRGQNWTRDWVHPYWLAVMLERIYQRVKDFDVKIIAGPLLGFGKNWDATEKYLRDVYQAGQRLYAWDNGRYPFDGVGYHLYVHPTFNSAQDRLEPYIQNTYREHLKRMQAVIKQQEGQESNKKLYISEFGWPCPNPSSETDQVFQAQAMQAAFDVLKDDPRVVIAIWFSTLDFPGEPFGLYKGEPLGVATQKKTLETFRAYAKSGGFLT